MKMKMPTLLPINSQPQAVYQHPQERLGVPQNDAPHWSQRLAKEAKQLVWLQRTFRTKQEPHTHKCTECGDTEKGVAGTSPPF